MKKIKTSLAKLETRTQRITEFIRNTEKSGKKCLDSATYISARLTLLEKHWSAYDEQFEVVQSEALDNGLTLEEVPYFQKSRYDDVEEAYVNAQMGLNDLLLNINGADVSTQAIGEIPPSQQALMPAIRMKPIEPPIFTGDVTQWNGFRDLFRAVVTDNVQLSNAQRLQYLRSSCQGEAGELIQDIDISDANFPVAWAALVKRYDNPRVVVAKLTERLLGLSTMKTNSAEDLRRLLDGTNRSVRSLKALKRPTDTWDDLLIALTVGKLDSATRYEWEKSIAASIKLPSFEELELFLDAQLRTLEALPELDRVTRERNVRSIRAHVVESKEDGCHICHEAHAIYNCHEFAAMSVAERKANVIKLRLCFNCLGNARHTCRQCPSTYSCKYCGRKHHTLLHDETASPSTNIQVMSNIAAANSIAQVYLGTARVVLHGNGRSISVRALIDNGSQASFVTENVVRQLRLKCVSADISIFGIGSSAAGNSSSQVEMQVAPKTGEQRVIVRPFVLKRVTGKLPSLSRGTVPLPILNGLQLADADDAESTAVDLLLGADVYSQIMHDEVHRPMGGEMIAQRTIFGWILIGRLNPTTVVGQVSVHHLLLEEQMRCFWEQEEAYSDPTTTNEENACEQLFYEGMRREADGRFTVRLPFRIMSSVLGDSRMNAERRLLQMERRFVRNSDLHEEYKKFMKAYRDLGHMELVPAEELASDGYYLPHHAVLKPSSTSTKLRVVFDASMQTTTGKSLNDMLMTGPRLQSDLINILMRWRTFRIAITADVEKMFRQVWIAPEHRKYQRILWRESSRDTICEYNLKTITYGTACAPYLAVKAMQQIAEEERLNFPAAAVVVKRDFYMDDCLTGADDVEQAIQLKNELLALMTAGGMKLLKWASNSKTFVEDLPTELRELSTERMIDTDDNIKTLGVRWYPAADEFGFAVKLADEVSDSKRAMLSEIARLFDPLSLLAPVIVHAKILMQSLWSYGTDWDAALPTEVAEKWRRFRRDLPLLAKIRVPRWCGIRAGDQWSIHAFCDASKAAYAACIYTRVQSADQGVRVQLMAARSRVAPLKQQTIPRLELNGAVLLVKLLKTVMKALDADDIPVTAWTDSTVVLAWLQGQANRWPTYVANRVGEIQANGGVSQWRHIAGVDNPADVASRGILPADLKSHVLWWTGPRWLQEDESSWPTISALSVDEEMLEEKKIINVNVVLKHEMWDLIERYSTFLKLTRVTAYCKRAFVKGVDRTGPLRAEELRASQAFWIGEAQKVAFTEEIHQLKMSSEVARSSSLLKLNPFVDQHGLLRVGGRLERAPLPYDERHPLILPHTGTLVRLLITEAHKRALHAGPKLTIAMLQQRFWILGVRSAVKAVLHRCVKCCRYRTIHEHQLMGILPAARVTQQRAFLHTAVDYAGPVMTRTTKGRGHHAHKAWIAVFVCLSSKATHLELVSDMSTQGFLAAFKRFTSRRGHCSDVYADNGTNFVGAESEMRRQVQQCMKDPDWSAMLADSGTRFHFAPPGSPHFNGLAEAAVKIAKSTMRRVIGDHTLTFEELTTLLAQIEAVMNSRPLTPLTRDKDDSAALTPGHLLIGQPLTAIPEPNLLQTQEGRLTRWQLVSKMLQHFWERWRREYLHHLQQREKWQVLRRPVKIGDVVLIRDENVPPMKWPLGRVTQTHPGSDGIVRVVTMKTATSELKRAITKLCILPTDNQ